MYNIKFNISHFLTFKSKTAHLQLFKIYYQILP